MTRRILLAAIAACVLLPFARADEPKVDGPKLEWVDEPGKHRTLMSDGKPLVRYMYEALDESTEERRGETYKPYLHVYSPDGETLLTKGPGGLFPHHRGIFYGFNKITYGDGKKCDTWHCTNGAYQSNEEFIESAVNGKQATLKVAIDWHGRGGEVFAHEKRTMTITPDENKTLVDFGSTLKTASDKPIHLDGDPQHAGVQFRATQHVPDKTAKQTYYIRTDGKGKPGETRNWDHNKKDAPHNEECTNRPWNAMSIVVDEKRFTVLYIDNPNNPKPARYSERDYGRFGSYFVADVTKDEPLEVNYGFVIVPGELTVEQCKDFKASQELRSAEQSASTK
jgi:hypothetical protein